MHVNRRQILTALATVSAVPAFGQGFAGLGQTATGFALPQRGYELRFPDDHGPHPAFRIEWWYVTATLTGADGQAYGVQWTLFRSSLTPELAAGWADPQIWFAHGAMTSAQAHLVAERVARGGIGQAGVRAVPFAAWIDNWAMTGTTAPSADPLDQLDLTAGGQDWRYDLRLSADGPLVLHGDAGFSLKHPRGQASHYYSQPHYTVEGTLTWPDRTVAVTGTAWLDREWSSQPLDADQTGWDWFSLHLASGDKLMVYQLRDRTGDAHIPGTWITRTGHSQAIGHGHITLRPTQFTQIDGRRIPTHWQISVPARDVEITVTPLNPRAWMGTGIAYWEGPVSVSGTHTGRGYLEMTGYE